MLTLLPNFGGFHRTLQLVRLANKGRLLLRTPGPVPFGTCICSNVETILSWTCHVYGPFQFRASLGTSILLGRDEVLMVPYTCCCFSARSIQGRIQGGAKIGHGGPLLQQTSSSDQKAKETNQMHSSDLEARGKKCSYFWFHSEVKFFDAFLTSFLDFYSFCLILMQFL